MTDASPKPKIPSRKSGVFVPHEPTFRQRAGAWLVVLVARALTSTLRYRWNDRSGF